MVTDLERYLVLGGHENIQFMSLNECPEIFYEFTFTSSVLKKYSISADNFHFVEMMDLAANSLAPLYKKSEDYLFTQPIISFRPAREAETITIFYVKIGLKKKTPPLENPLLDSKEWSLKIGTSIALDNVMFHGGFSTLREILKHGKENFLQNGKVKKKVVRELDKIFKDLRVEW